MFYGQQTWDPVLICGQILALQALFYVSLGSILWLLLGACAWLRPPPAWSPCTHISSGIPCTIALHAINDCPSSTGAHVPHLSLHYLFDWRWVSFSTFTGWMIVIACVFNALAASICLMMLVRSALLFTYLLPPAALQASCCNRMLVKSLER